MGGLSGGGKNLGVLRGKQQLPDETGPPGMSELQGKRREGEMGVRARWGCRIGSGEDRTMWVEAESEGHPGTWVLRADGPPE